MSKFIIIVYVFVTMIFAFGCNTTKEISENNIIKDNITEEQIIESLEFNNIQENEILTNISNETAKEATNEKTINNSENITKNTTTKPKNEVVSKQTPSEKQIQEPVIKKDETNTIVPIKENNTPSEITPVPTPEETPKPDIPETPKKSGYFYNASESNFLISEFNRLTNGNSSYTVKISSNAKNSNPFWPYKESEINKQISNISFGDFIVYAEDYYKDDIKQRTLYYICFDS